MGRVRVRCVVAMVVALSSCTRGASPSLAPATRAATAADPALARVGDVAILRSDVATQMRATGQNERAALDDLIHFELLARAAAQSVSPADHDVRAATEAMLVQRYIETDLEPHLGKADIPDDVLRGVYDRALKIFVHPRLVDVATLSVYTGARMKPEPRARATAAAHALDELLRRSPRHTVDEFESIARDPAWKERKVQYSRTWQAIDDPFPAEFGREAQRLARPGDVTPMVAAQTGFHVALYLGERPSENVTFAEARDRLRDEIYERWRTGRFLEFTQAAAGAHTIEAYPSNWGP